MNTGENIRNAFDVVAQTHRNVSKLIDYCKSAASEKGEFVLATPKFLRYKSDNDTDGWNLSSFILLFQNEKDKRLKNSWRDGPVYVLEINLFQPDAYEEPMVNIAKFTYADIQAWSEGCSPANHWIFYHPLYYILEFEKKFEKEVCYYTAEVTDKDDADKRYWGLRRVIGMEIPLTEINSENAYETIFGGFRALIEK